MLSLEPEPADARIDPEQHTRDRDTGHRRLAVAGRAGHFDEVSVQGDGDAGMGRRERERSPWMA